MGNLRIVDAIIILVYFLAMGILGVVGYRKNNNSEDYFIAGRTLGTFSIAAMWMSSWIGGSSIVGTSTSAYNLGLTGGWYVVILALGCVIFGLTFSQITTRVGEKLKNITYPQLISCRYDNRSGMVVVVCCFLANLGFLASQLVAMGSMLVTITGWSSGTCFLISTIVTILYSAIGGLLAITYTTWIQFILIIAGTVVLGVPLASHAIGGLSNLTALPPEYFDIGRQGWGTIIALAVSSIFSFFTSMDSYTRCFAAKSEKASRYGTLWAGIAILFIAFGATVIGLCARYLMPELPSGSSAYAAIVANYFPTGISGLVLVGVFAAIMSTGVVCINGCAANITMDIIKERLNPTISASSLKVVGIASSFIVGIIGALLAWWKYDIIQLLLLAFTFEAASLFFPTVCGVFWKKPTAKASFLAMLSSLIVVLLWQIGNMFQPGGIFSVDALWPGLLVNGLVFFGFTFTDQPTELELKNRDIFFAASSGEAIK